MGVHGRESEWESAEFLRDLFVPALARAVEESYADFWANFGSLPYVELQSDSGVLRFATGIQDSNFNRSFLARFDPDYAYAEIEMVVAYFRSRAVSFTWTTGPLTQPADLGTRLEAHGFTHTGSAPGAAADLLALPENQPAPSGLSIREVSDEEGHERWMRVWSSVDQIPDWARPSWYELFRGYGWGSHLRLRRYVGYLNGDAVATSALFLGSSVASLECVAVLPEARRQGIGTAIVLEPLLEARRLGYRVGMLQPPQMGLNMYRSPGFRECCALNFYLWKSET